MSGRRVRTLSIAGCLLSLASGVQAQRLSGTLTHEGSRAPVGGALVLLLGESRDTILARGTTSATGHYLLQAPGAGVYRVRVLRVGQRPLVRGPFRIGAGETISEPIVVSEQPIQLARFDVRASSGCRRRPDSTTLVGQLLAEARTAFLASVSTTPDGESRATYRRYRRLEDRKGGEAGVEANAIEVRASTSPFVSIAIDSLARVGYVVPEGDSITYHAPDAHVLLSRHFSDLHCFQVVQGDSTHPDALGIQFRPVIRRDRVRDISGTIWMRPGSTVLHEVVYHYDPPTAEDREGRIGGTVAFDTTTSGIWFVRNWQIRMPQTSESRIGPDLSRQAAPEQSFRRLERVHVSGGVVMNVRLSSAVLFVDSAETRRAEEAERLWAQQQQASREQADREAVSSLLEGSCGGLRAPERGAISGRVIGPSGAPLVGVPVRASWRVVLADGSLLGYRDDRAETRTTVDGRFVLCPIPLETPVQVGTVIERRTGIMSTVRLAPSTLHESVRLTVPLGQLAGAAREAQQAVEIAAAEAAGGGGASSALLAVRVRDGSGAPIHGAEVILSTATSDTLMTTDVEGVVRLTTVADTVDLLVRQAGLEPVSRRLQLSGGENDVDVQLRNTNRMLETLRTTARRNEARQTEIDERIRRGVPNAAIRRADIQRERASLLSDLLRPVRGIDVTSRDGGMMAVSRRGGNASLQEGTGGTVCVLRVMVDNVLRPLDTSLDAIPLTDIYAVEVYLGPARIPLQFGSTGENLWCGVIAIWTLQR
ncbi:hypothetical protein [Gemmatimonas aurantiaca]|uniref:carboxypeptidase-like regulatory domain-containing protein n=1 Tax=Gemmatimonas aurantiaca TaxID=173480 RepID=UPI00301E32A4